MRPRALNPNVYPSGGYYFNEGELRIEGTDVGDVAKKVAEFRARRSLPAGDPLAEVTKFTCDRYPPACRDVAAPLPPNDEDTSRKLGDRVYRWLGETGTSEVGVVKKDEAQRRAEICAACPANLPWSGCGGCHSHARNLSFGLRRGMEVKSSERLHGCSELGEDTRASVWLTQKATARIDLPTGCWRKS